MMRSWLSGFAVFLQLFVVFGLYAQPQKQIALQTEIPGYIAKLGSDLPDSQVLDYYQKIINYYNNIDNDSAILFSRQGLEHFKTSNYKKGEARMVLSLGNYDDTHGNSASASEKILYAISLFKEAGDDLGKADAFNIIGVVEARKGNFEKAIYYFIEAQKIYIEHQSKIGLFSTWMNLGLSYDSINDSAKLFSYYNKADSIAKMLPLNENILGLYNNLGASYFEHHDTVNGFLYLTKALRLSDKPEYIISHIVCLMSMGEVMSECGRPKEGERYLQQALGLSRQHNLPDQEAGILVNMVVLSNGANKDSCIAYLNRALALVMATGNKPRKLSVYRAFETLYEMNENYKEANKYLKLSHALSDSMFNIYKSKEIANIAAVYDLQQSNNKINDLEVLIRKNDAKRNIIIAIMLVLLVFVGVLYHFYNKARNLNIDLAAGKKELAQLNNMKDKLFSVIGHDLRGPVANIPVLLEMIEAEEAVDENYIEAFGLLKEQANNTVEILDKLLLLGKSVMKGKNFNPVSFETKPNVTKNIELLSLTAANKNITINDHSRDDLVVFADPAHFDFILRNLISNAIKFSFPGGVINIQGLPDDKPGFLRFSVKDSGAGIRKDALPHMFKSTVTSTYGTANEKGTGIGLMLCEEFATLNCGTIGVDSKEGEGSTFYFTMKKGVLQK